ncbi:allantoicase-like isoform X2 [Hylaeus volcanicus]|uniref:allantoicase-like isoform X2 n=1 Tax=Hylaeus volcanicus TaxID=313075 RepID=UPI0023B7CAEC|nr:allantoicase-like isoform X2 [Hylaeus volcanicus]
MGGHQKTTTPRVDRRRRNTHQQNLASSVFREAIPSPCVAQKSSLNMERTSQPTFKSTITTPITYVNEESSKCHSFNYEQEDSCFVNVHQCNSIEKETFDRDDTNLMDNQAIVKKRPHLEKSITNEESVGASDTPNFLKKQWVHSFLPKLRAPRLSLPLKKLLLKKKNSLPFLPNKSAIRKNILFSPQTSNLSTRASFDMLNPGLSTTPYFTRLNDLASEDFNGNIIYCTDDFFSPVKNILKSTLPQKREPFENVDGWETRRKKTTGHNWCLIQLGTPGRIYGIEINTRYLGDDCAPYISVEAANCSKLENDIREHLQKKGLASYDPQIVNELENLQLESEMNNLLKEKKLENSTQWNDIVSMMPLSSSEHSEASKFFIETNQKNLFPVVTHLRLNLFPDGGIARIRVYGVACNEFNLGKTINVACVLNGAVVIGCSNESRGISKKLLYPSVPKCMADGWLTARNPGRYPYIEQDSMSGDPLNLVGEHWVIIKLGMKIQSIAYIEIDTSYFIGNAPNKIEIETANISSHVDLHDIQAQQQLLVTDRTNGGLWEKLLLPTTVKPNRNHYLYLQETFHTPSFHNASTSNDSCGIIALKPSFPYEKKPVTHIKLTIFPDGGVQRIRVWSKTCEL